MTAHTLSLALFLAGCFGTGTDASAPQPASSPLSTPSRGSAAPAVDPGGSAIQDTLSRAQREACGSFLATVPDGPVHVVGRSAVEGGELLRVAWAEPSHGGQQTWPGTQLLYLTGDACADPEVAEVPVAWAVLRALYTSPTVNDRIAALEIEAEGGLEAAQREIGASEATSFPIRECWPGEAYAEALCTRPELAAAYRRAGLQIEAPKVLAPYLTIDASGVPDSLHECIPTSFRNENGEVVLLGSVEEGSRRLLVFERFDGTRRGAAYNTHVAGARQDPTGECADLDPPDSDATSATTERLLQRSEIARRSAVEHVTRVGGVDAYLELVRNADNPQAPYRCGAGQIPADHRCVTDGQSAALEAAGVPVQAPRSF